MEKAKPKKKVPFSFVLEELDSLSPILKPMFGCFMVYIGEKMVLFLCEREKKPFHKGIWVATTPEHYESLSRELSLPIEEQPWKPGKSPWLTIPAGTVNFEAQASRVCELILSRDKRIGRIKEEKLIKPSAAKLQPTGRRGDGATGRKNLQRKQEVSVLFHKGKTKSRNNKTG